MCPVLGEPGSTFSLVGRTSGAARSSGAFCLLLAFWTGNKMGLLHVYVVACYRKPLEVPLIARCHSSALRALRGFATLPVATTRSTWSSHGRGRSEPRAKPEKLLHVRTGPLCSIFSFPSTASRRSNAKPAVAGHPEENAVKWHKGECINLDSAAILPKTACHMMSVCVFFVFLQGTLFWNHLKEVMFHPCRSGALEKRQIMNGFAFNSLKTALDLCPSILPAPWRFGIGL